MGSTGWKHGGYVEVDIAKGILWDMALAVSIRQ